MANRSAVMDSKKLAAFCRKLADDKKGENIVVLDLRELSSVADYFVIVSATSEPHMRAVADEIVEKARVEHGLRPRALDGTTRTSWLVIDFVDVVVHVMRAETRTHYDLEGLWSDAPRLKARKPRARKTVVPATE